ncbi:MAG: DUF2335 domain-containing protein [Fusobacteriaceae bacterium]|jgi:uncharacterized membrane protein|nr:DUF2335 domain-containing protein [Fusobacteriaceae bacterium]
MTSVERQESFSGPLPHPGILKMYEDIIPGSADRLMSMAENNQRLQADVINREQRHNNRYYFIGLCFAFILALIGICGSIVLFYNGKTKEGTAVLGGTLSTIIGSFIYGNKRNNKKENKQ